MKLKYITALFLAAGLVCSCNRIDIVDGTEGADVVLRAGLPTVQSKTWLDYASGGTPLKVYWSDGDQINVNGRTSVPLSIPVGGKVTEAEFYLPEAASPYNVIYPGSVVMEDVYDSEGTIAVNLPSIQKYTPSTFASGAAVMYGYSADPDENVVLRNLCAAVRVNLKGTDKITRVVVESSDSKAPLCGKFRLCPQNGNLTVVEGSSQLIIDLEEVTLSEGGTDFYFTLPYGDYSTGLKIFFRRGSDNREMLCIWTPESELQPGTLYSFNNVEFSEGAKEIVSADEWNEFAAAFNGNNQENLKKYLYKDNIVRLGADITAEQLTTITKDFPHVLEGNGRTITITNATKSLFSKMSGGVRNLTLAGNLTLSAQGAPFVTEMLDGGKISDCTNKMTVACNTSANAYVSGIVAFLRGATVENCVNEGSITVKADVSENTGNLYNAVGGIVGMILAGDKETALIDCKNIGAVTLQPKSGADHTYGAALTGLGGVVGWLRTASKFTIDDCDNTAPVTLSADDIVSETGLRKAPICVGGIVGLGSTNSTAKLTVPSEGDGHKIVMKDCENSGTVHNNGANYSAGKESENKVFTGGLAGSLMGDALKYASITSCSNTGDVFTYDLTGDDSSSRPVYCAVAGGFIGFGGYLDMDGCVVNCQIGNGRRGSAAWGGMIGFCVRPFKLNNSEIRYSGYFNRCSFYNMNRAVVAVVPVLYNETDMTIAPDISGSTITGTLVLSGSLNAGKDYLQASDNYDASSNAMTVVLNSEDNIIKNLTNGKGAKANEGLTYSSATITYK